MHSKVTRPQLVAQSIPRHALRQRLDGGLLVGLTLISAPAGFGKTTLAVEWLEHSGQAASEKAAGRDAGLQTLPFAACWLTLDEHDNDPMRFWRYVIASINSHSAPELASASEQLLAQFDSAHPPSLESVVESVAGLLASHAQPVVLVIDDYHAVRTQQIHDSLYYLLANLPENAHIVLLTRADPPLPLNRWRSQGRLLELRAADLCFSPEEAGAMLSRRTRLVLPPDMVVRLVTHTDGWPAGLQLLAASLQGRSQREIDRFVRGFTGSSRYVLDYLMEEVLQSQPYPVRDFLLRTSILTRLCAPLCDELLGVEDDRQDGDTVETPVTSRTILGYLESTNLFLVPLDGNRGWYRYYHLFANALHDELDRSEPELGAELHRRASRWYAKNGYETEAVEHALLGKDWSLAADQIAVIAHELMLRGEFETLTRWIESMPPELVDERPRLNITRGWVLLFRGPLHEVESIVEELAEQLESSTGDRDFVGHPGAGEVAALRASVASFRWDVRRTTDLCRTALALLPEEDHFSLSAVHHALGHAHLLGGEFSDAVAAYLRALNETQHLNSPYMRLFPTARLGHSHLLQGNLRLANQVFRGLLKSSSDAGGAEWPINADAYVGLADLLCERNELLAAEHYVRRGLALAPQRSVEIWAIGAAHQLRVSMALGRRDDSAAAVEDAIRRAYQYNNTLLAGWLEAHLARAHLAAGDLETVRQWATRVTSTSGLEGYMPEYEELTLVRFYLADHRPRAALALLAEWEDRAESHFRRRTLIEIYQLQTIALLAMGQREDALAALQRALVLAEPESALRGFLDCGPMILPLLQTLSPTSPFAERIVNAILEQDQSPDAMALQQPLDRLTPRENEILRMMARGASNQEIAEVFVLTVGTVKGHVNHILSKLGARNRTEAVARARELGLI